MSAARPTGLDQTKKRTSESLPDVSLLELT